MQETKLKHSLLIALQGTRATLTVCEQTCPHWDMESDGDGGQTCCHDLADAQQKHRAALARWRKGRFL